MATDRTPACEIVFDFFGEEFSVDLITNLVELYAFQGFDPVTIHREILRCAKDAGRNWKEDVRSMIILNVTRGNKVSKMSARMTEKGKAELAKLIAAYKLKDSKPGAKDITLARVANVHGPTTCKILRHVADRLPVTLEFMERLVPGYPVSMMHPSFAGLINPNLREYKEIVAAHSLYLFEFAKVINPNKPKDRASVVASFTQPLAAAIASSFFPDDKKNLILKELGIIDDNFNVSPVVKKAAAFYNGLE
ncbi:nucleocapsid protein [Toyo virus]|uniref:Nucleoprotein n=1 Tax=Toyo virus TaxID=2874031 RepID=A0ABM7PPD0_9VIRU|nr:nucleocapsid protein [Toyo virus]BCT55142.1 nucleocapsid protein [Toyo virus]